MQNITFEQRVKMLTDLGLEKNGNGDYERLDIIVFQENLTELTDESFESYVAEVKGYMLSNPADYPMPAVPGQQLTIIDRAKETLLTGGSILQRNQQKAATFVKASQTLIAKIKANGNKLNAELDTTANDAVIKLKKAADEVDEDTKPIRQAMVMIRDELNGCKTAIETELNIIKKYRDDWALECKREAERKAEEERRAAIRRQEIIDTKANIEKALLKHFNDHLFSKKQSISASFNAITLADYEEKSAGLVNWIPAYAPIHYSQFNYRYGGIILTAAEVGELVTSIKTEEKFNELASIYFDEMIALRGEKIDLLPSKKAELDRIAEFEREQEEERARQAAIEEERKTADAARQKELAKLKEESDKRAAEARQKELEEKQAQADREAEEKRQAEEENAKAMAAQQTKIDISAAQQTTQSLFEQVVNTMPSQAGPKAKTVLKATITHAVGLYPIFQLWVENVAKDMTVEELMDKCSFMFTYASKQANAKAPLQIENEFVKYVEGTKAVVSRESKKKEAIS